MLGAQADRPGRDDSRRRWQVGRWQVERWQVERAASLAKRCGCRVRVLLCPDRSWGRGLRGKRARKYERAGFTRCPSVTLARNIAEADLIYVRNIPERTTVDRLRELEGTLRRRPGTRVINHPRSFTLYDSKDRSFEAWQSAGLHTPHNVTCDSLEQLERLADSFESVLVRVNNEACGNGTALLHRPSPVELRAAYDHASRCAQDLRAAGREDSKVMAVAFLDSRSEDGYYQIFRAFVVAGTVHGGYALISTRPVVNLTTAVCGTDQEAELFLALNSRLDTMLADASCRRLMLQATAALDLDIAALDFLLINDRIVLLEANPLWSPSYRWAGGRRGQRHYLADPARWHQQAAGYSRWMDRITFYQGMYSLFDRF